MFSRELDTVPSSARVLANFPWLFVHLTSPHSYSVSLVCLLQSPGLFIGTSENSKCVTYPTSSDLCGPTRSAVTASYSVQLEIYNSRTRARVRERLRLYFDDGLKVFSEILSSPAACWKSSSPPNPDSCPLCSVPTYSQIHDSRVNTSIYKNLACKCLTIFELFSKNNSLRMIIPSIANFDLRIVASGFFLFLCKISRGLHIDIKVRKNEK